MRKILITFKKPEGSQYLGGVVSVINSYIEREDLFIQNGFCIETFNYNLPKFANKFPQKIENVMYGVAQAKALKKYLKDERETVVHIHTSRSFLFLKDLLVARYINQSLGNDVVLTIHVGAGETIFSRISKTKNLCIKIMNENLGKIIFLSKSLREEFIEMGVNPEKCEVLYNFHNLSPITHKKREPDARLHLLYVGALYREKGIMDLLKALQLVKTDFRLNICGQLTENSIEDEFNSLVSSMKDKIQICGYVRGTEKSEIFDDADVLILPSYHEGFPLVILEALASGTGIISTKVGATPEILNDENVIWVDIGDIKAISDALEYLAQNRKILDNMKECNYRLSSDFSIEKNIDALCSIYKGL